MTSSAAAPPYTLDVQAALARLDSAPSGLTGAEAAQRLAQHGPNELQAAPTVSPWALLAAQFRNVLILILLGATALSAVLGHAVEAMAITVIVLFAVLLGFVQEYRAEKAMTALRALAAPSATALRDGEQTEVAARDLVPGDVILLTAGDRVPADARVLQAFSLAAQEAALTGESLPVDKHSAALADAQLPVGDRRNMAFAGTSITSGRGRALVTATGMATEFGRIAQMLQTVETSKTPLQVNLDRLGAQLARAAFAVVAIIVVLGLARGQPFIEMLVFGIALAVAVVPEALPAVVTISLALGVQRLVKRHALIRRLAAVETLGSTTVILSDKTGTLTRDEMTARRLWVAGEWIDVGGSGYVPQGEFTREGAPIEPEAALRELLSAGALCADTHVLHTEDGRWLLKGDPTEGALVVAAAKAGLHKAQLEAKFPRIDEIPFDADSRRMTTLHAVHGRTVAYAKGAPEVIVAACTQVAGAHADLALDDARREQALAAARAMAGHALRVIAVARKADAARGEVDAGLTLLGLVGLIDPPRLEAKAAIEACERAGIRVAMITGDHPQTAAAVARELGLLKADGRVITGAELDAMDDTAFAREVERISVFARVSPAHKLRAVTALQARGQVVAMTGDGVNDAPALKRADIGVAMGITGTDVAKEAAAMTLTDDNFASIVAAVEEGRGIFGNIRKYLMFLLSSNIGEIGLMAGAALIGLPLPLTAVQILYVNLATDGLPALALAVDPPERDLMQRPPRDPHAGIFTRPVVTLMLVGGLWSMVVNLALFAWALQSGRGLTEAMTMAFVSLVLIQFLKAYSFRSDRLSVLNRPFANRWLNLAIGWELLLLAAIVYVPFLQAPFSTFALPLDDALLIVATAATILPVMEIAKVVARRSHATA
jgi:Ca2+-transporting ATPase